ncbi:hypothetical protein Pmani_004194 [Petrolisthes manimaculis]|uniref:Pro-resilin n=1 Tax=Petrolisthes manimaculis TaxID=1843537 RepID=A0AAE1UNK3_9EUCA|nr:hypothetical protein Pmani_004194 [Petrolisthes manimaculis]
MAGQRLYNGEENISCHQTRSTSPNITMLCKIVFVALVVVAAVGADRPSSYRPPRPSYRPPTYRTQDPVGPAEYDFNWAVNDHEGNDFGHNEAGNGYNTEGSYYVQLPDGRLQKVTYTVNDDSGYLAQVEYQGEAQYPQQSYKPAPSYQRPRPSYQ